MVDTVLIQDRYQLRERIGRGGMGEVWRAHDHALDREVAVKCLKPLECHGDRSFIRVLRERFRREARVAASLQHPGVTVVHDFGTDDGVLFLVMELLDGHNLSQLLQENGQRPLPVREILDIAGQVAAALAYTHQRDIVHRDLKPANVMRTASGDVKICDFGIAHLNHDIGVSSRLTSGGIAMGTPHYMSPEQIGGAYVDHRSDLYSLGCVLYEMATGTPPFDDGDAWAVLVGHRDTPPEPPRSHRTELPEPLERLILTLLAKEPGERPPNASALGRELAALRAGEWAVDPLAPPPGPSSEAPLGPPGGDARLPAWSSGITTGRKASHPVASGVTGRAYGPVPELTGQWTGLVQPPLVAAPGGVPPGPGTPPGAVSGPVPRPGTSGPAPEPATTLADRHQRALSLGRLGRWHEAEAAHRALATARQHALGADHPDTLASRYEAGFALCRLGRYADAARAYEQVAAGRGRRLGPDHAETLAARQETAYVLGRLGRHTEAHQVYSAVLEARVRTMGADHPHTLRCRHNLAFNLSRLGRLEDSYRMAHEVAGARARVLGADHPDTLVTRYEVAYALGRLERWDAALRAYQEVTEARVRTLGADHPDTLAAHYEAALCLGRLGRTEEALAAYRELAAARTRAHGSAHPETLRARHGVGVNLGRLGRWEEAWSEATEVAGARAHVLGPDHPDTLVSLRESAVALGRLGRWGEALEAYRQVADARQRLLGAEHPDALRSRYDEAHCLERLGRARAAARLYEQVDALRRWPGVSPR
ncbi:tetratricopeptide repeat protein [Streptomyces oceani]|uniref:non-specific serine/threonine protein kinase n=1 Tax=Streptomyces oceani TaxID=1075402 RepID=A0A1E7JXR2_9ACTN|nr:serine/threonine-protein kinase [Streptomyces oceani]OEU96464.1 serine/threonine protein kinase [Streptomyces oceani]